MRKLAPVALFVYNRADYTIKTIEYLKKNFLAKETELFIYSDAAKKPEQEEKVSKVREVISHVEGFKKVTIILAEKNKGLAKSIISGVSELMALYGRVIVLEDDILASPQFLNFMNDALDFYENKPEIWSISAYNFPIEIPDSYKSSIYFAYRSSSWGWATWENRWSTIDWDIKDYSSYRLNPIKIHHFCKGGNDLDKMLRYQMKGKIDSWAIRWCYNQSFQNKYTVYPVKSFVTNIGTDGSGTHCDPTSARFNVKLSDEYSYSFEDNVTFERKILRNFKRFLDRSLWRMIRNKLSKFG
jgi:hypothetical protein